MSAETKPVPPPVPPRSLVLVGMMGAGKSAVGRRLAAVFGLPFIDADEDIETAAGCSISDIFALHGEEAFRDGERRVIERTAELVALARPMAVTFHRAFDVCRDPFEALEQLVELGVERVLTPDAAARGIMITNARGVFSEPIAEYTMMMILSVLRRLPELYELQRERTWQPLPAREMRQVTVGIVGLGSIGRNVARLALAFGARVIGTRKEPDLRKDFTEPRIHMAINCASVGCPPLRAEPFTAERLDAQLAEALLAIARNTEGTARRAAFEGFVHTAAMSSDRPAEATAKLFREAFALADRISVLVYGEIMATGSVQEIRANQAVQQAYLGGTGPSP